MTLQRNGDLVTNTYLRVTLPTTAAGNTVKWAWVKQVGHALISSVELNIGGTKIDKQYSDWFNIWTDLTNKVGQARGYAKLIGDTPELTELSTAHDAAVLYVPLHFFFNRNAGLALPLIALQYHDVRFEFEFRALSDLVVYAGATAPTLGDLTTASLFVDYVYLDAEERKKFAQASHEYLIEQVQFTGDESVTGQYPKPRLNFNHPCKALYWVLKLGKHTSGQKYLAYGSDITAVRLQATKRFVLAVAKYSGDDLDLSNNTVQPASGLAAALVTKFNAAKPVAIAASVADVDNITITGDLLSIADVSTPTATLLAGVTRASVGDGAASNDVTVKFWSNYGIYLDTTGNPVDQVLIQLNGHDRFSKRDSNYTNFVQPWQHHSNTPADGVNMYSFALNVEEHQPSGSCNMSRIDNATLNLDIKSGVDLSDAKLSVYALNFNVLRVLSGMGGLKMDALKRIHIRAEKLPTKIIWALILAKLVRLPSLHTAMSEASRRNLILSARYLVVRETPKAVSTKGHIERLSWLRIMNSGTVIMKQMMDIYPEMGNPHGYDLHSFLWLEHGQPSETERISVFYEGLTNLRKLKIQSIPPEKSGGSKVPTPTKHFIFNLITLYNNINCIRILKN